MMVCYIVSLECTSSRGKKTTDPLGHSCGLKYDVFVCEEMIRELPEPRKIFSIIYNYS